MTIDQVKRILLAKDHEVTYSKEYNQHHHECGGVACHECEFLISAGDCELTESDVPEEHLYYLKEYHPELLI